MNTKVYFDNLPATVTEKELMELFSVHGNVVDIHIFIDHARAEARNYGFVTMITSEGAREAIKSINGRAFGSRNVVLSEAAPIQEAAGFAGFRTNPRRMMSRLF
jgi:RNA recognition motif-containing protein